MKVHLKEVDVVLSGKTYQRTACGRPLKRLDWSRDLRAVTCKVCMRTIPYWLAKEKYLLEDETI